VIAVPQKETGTVYTADVSRVQELDRFCAEVWLITRAGRDIPGAMRVRALSPGESLFRDYLEKWRFNPPEQWWPEYRERFNTELQQPEKGPVMQRLHKLLAEGKNVGLVCFCPDYRYCHRTLVGEFLKQRGIAVEEISPPPEEKKTGAQYIQEAFNFG